MGDRARVVIATDSFKGSADAGTAVRALARGWAAERPSDEIVVLPMADGGEGTVEAVAAAMPGARRREAPVIGPDGRAARALWLELPDGSAIVELASASGLLLLEHPLPEAAHTYGFGQAIRAALDAGASRVYAAVGGSASTDGGAGMLRALGAGFADADPVDGWLGLPRACVAADFRALAPLPPGGVRLWSDVTHPLLGPEGAVRVFGPQKGVDERLAPVLEHRLVRFADAVERETGRTLREISGAGAAGGTGFGLLAWGAEPERGSAAVAAITGLPAALAGADVVLTGEGRYDAQSIRGKAVSEVLSLAAAAAGGRCGAFVVAGGVDERGLGPGPIVGGAPPTLISLTGLAGSRAAAMREAEHWLARAGAHAARAWSDDRRGEEQ